MAPWHSNGPRCSNTRVGAQPVATPSPFGGGGSRSSPVPAYCLLMSSPWSAHSTLKRASTWRRRWQRGVAGAEEWASAQEGGGAQQAGAQQAAAEFSQQCAQRPGPAPAWASGRRRRTSGSVVGSFSPLARMPSVRSTVSSAVRPSTPCWTVRSAADAVGGLGACVRWGLPWLRAPWELAPQRSPPSAQQSRRVPAPAPHLHHVGAVEAVDAVDAEHARLAARLGHRAGRGAGRRRRLHVQPKVVGITLDLSPQHGQPGNEEG
jgi:hypothetical protein